MPVPDLARYHPTATHVLVHLRPGKQTTASGLVLPPDSQQITQYGDVLSIGPDVTLVSPGDIVLVDLHAGTTVQWKQNTPVILVLESDIQAIIQPDPPTEA